MKFCRGILEIGLKAEMLTASAAGSIYFMAAVFLALAA